MSARKAGWGRKGQLPLVLITPCSGGRGRHNRFVSPQVEHVAAPGSAPQPRRLVPWPSQPALPTRNAPDSSTGSRLCPGPARVGCLAARTAAAAAYTQAERLFASTWQHKGQHHGCLPSKADFYGVRQASAACRVQARTQVRCCECSTLASQVVKAEHGQMSRFLAGDLKR